jgi:aspartyl-tRNA synthetase
MNIPNVPAVKVNEEKKMQNKFIGRKSEKIVPFLDSEISIKKLSINQVVRVQSLTKEMEDSRDALGGIKILLLVLREGAPELSELSDEEIQDGVGHMLEAFEVGTPPHGGIAFGLDRHVMMLANESSLREVIAFPMSSSGKTAVMDAPSPVTSAQLKELHLSVEAKKASQK